MPDVCPACGMFALDNRERRPDRARCTACGHEEPLAVRPLFVVTGASGVGKTALARALPRLLPECDVFESDILWRGDVHVTIEQWLRIASAVAQSGRHVVLCGTLLPRDVDAAPSRSFVGTVHCLNLHCDDATRAARLRARPAWRGWSEALVAEHARFAAWLLAHAESDFEPPLETLDVSRLSAEEVAREVRAWVLARLEKGPRPPGRRAGPAERQ